GCREGLNHIAGFDVAVIRDRDTALHAVGDLFGIVLEAAQRSDLAFEDDHVISQQANFGVPLDGAIAHATTGNRANFRNAEGFENFGASLIGLFERWFKKTAHGALDLILQLVNDRVQADIDFFLLRQFLRFALRANVEADDDRIRSRCEQHVGFGNGADARSQQLQANLVVRKFREQVAEHFDRALYVAFEDDVEFLGASGLDLLRQSLKRHARTLGQLGFAGFLFAVFRDAAGLVAIGDNHELIAGLRQAF